HYTRHALSLPRFDHSCGTERQQANHRADFQPRRIAIRELQHVVVEPICFVPHAARPSMVHCVCYPEEMLNELHGDILIARSVGSHLDGNLQHVLAEERDPSRAVSLLQVTARWQGSTAIEDADVVQAKETTLKQVPTEPVFAVYPPTEVQQQFSKGALEEI